MNYVDEVQAESFYSPAHYEMMKQHNARVREFYKPSGDLEKVTDEAKKRWVTDATVKARQRAKVKANLLTEEQQLEIALRSLQRENN